MLELVVLAQVVIAEGAPENATAMVPDAALALAAHHVLQRAGARVRLQALSTVAHPRFAKITYCSLEA